MPASHPPITPDTRFRVGRSVGRTVYIQRGSEAEKGDHLIGVMDTPWLAALVVAALNGWQERWPTA